MAVTSRNNCIDGIIWVNDSYMDIQCNKQVSCAIPHSTGPHCYVHEAQWRGCCIKIPKIPNWAVPDKTKIFLVHKNNFRSASRGKIFGYFVLKRFEEIQVLQRAITTPHTQDVSFCLTLFENRFAFGARLRDQSFYMVDALAMDVTDKFKTELDRQEPDICKKWTSANGAEMKKKIMNQGRDIFTQVVHGIHCKNDPNETDERIVTGINSKRMPETKIPSELQKLATIKGELVLFTNPPILEHHPYAKFSGLRRIDGNHLIEQIADGIATPTIRYFIDTSKLSPRQYLAVKISEELKINRTLAQNILSNLPTLISEEIASNGKLRTRGFGSFEVKARKQRIGRNPQTGKPIIIPKQNYVKFKSSKKLKDKVNLIQPVK